MEAAADGFIRSDERQLSKFHYLKPDRQKTAQFRPRSVI